MPATLRNDQYERLVDRLRHAEQYAKAASGMAEEALSAYGALNREVVAMTATPDEHMVNQLRRADAYAEAAARAVEEALSLLEAAKAKEDDDA